MLADMLAALDGWIAQLDAETDIDNARCVHCLTPIGMQPGNSCAACQ